MDQIRKLLDLIYRVYDMVRGKETPRPNNNCNSMAAHDSCGEVFISYRKDVGDNFTEFLHSALKREGIDAFIDGENRSRREMLPNLFQTIRSFKISIPILSESFFASEWCLSELAEMVECYKSKGQIILPIIFDVEAEDVRNQTGIIKALFESHKKRNDEQTLKRWKNASTVVGGILGYQLKDVKWDDRKMIELVVEWVLTESSCCSVVEYPIGLSTRVEEIEKLLHSDGVAFVGIYGERGIGKTTIAQALYKRYYREYDKTCFLKNIGEEASKGLENLQKQLIKSISKKDDVLILNVAEGKELIQEKLRGEKVLLILDGVDSEDQFKAFAIEFNWFESGSKIIVTSRKENILKSFYRIDEAKIYCPQRLDKRQSCELFSWHAFSQKHFPEDHTKFCTNVVQLAEGSPSNLVELASFLLNGNEKDVEVWEARLKGLKKITGSDLHQRIDKWYDDIKQDGPPPLAFGVISEELKRGGRNFCRKYGA
ncbi:hypothetical protein NE237_031154 [Protea cynaroides]|uniref:TIR domain-containing protein n=1 Tax=Protea cynaroides TaxID=273540 RepID=A0A9Q0L0N2_9MAGN|nr:hypothetical protein NE237_031154 [Protea cynaroides]